MASDIHKRNRRNQNTALGLQMEVCTQGEKVHAFKKNEGKKYYIFEIGQLCQPIYIINHIINPKWKQRLHSALSQEFL